MTTFGYLESAHGDAGGKVKKFTLSAQVEEADSVFEATGDEAFALGVQGGVEQMILVQSQDLFAGTHIPAKGRGIATGH